MSGGLRHTPAGLASLECRLKHASRVNEAGFEREVVCEMPLRGFGTVAKRLALLPDGVPVHVTGFLDRAGARDARPVLHVTEFELLEE